LSCLPEQWGLCRRLTKDLERRSPVVPAAAQAAPLSSGTDREEALCDGSD
jgi:hypothetical protein